MASKVFGSVILGLLVGIAIGVVAYKIPQWIFDSSKPSTNLSSTELKATHSKNHYIDQEQTGFDSIFVEEFSYSDLHKLSEDLLLLDQHDLLNLVEKSLTQSLISVDFKVQDMLVEMLAQNSPDEAVASVVKFADHRKRILLHSIFTNWSLTNFEQALSTASELPPSDRRFAIKAVLAVGTGLSSQELSSIASKFNVDNEVSMWEQELDFYDKLADEPSSAFYLLAKDEVNDFQQIDLFKQVVLQWSQYDGIGIIFELDSADLSDDVFNQLIELVTEKDRETALELMIGDDRPGIPWGLGNSLIDSWIDDDVDEAFDALQKLPKSPFRSTMLQRVISVWGQRAPTVVLNRLREIPRLFRSSALSAAAIELAKDNPKAALDQVLTFSSVPGTNIEGATKHMISAWAKDAPNLALEWIESHSEEGSIYRKELLSEVLSQFALNEPTKAMTIAVGEFGDDYAGSRLQSQVLRSLVNAGRLDEAQRLLNLVRGEESQVWETVQVAMAFIRNERMDDALSLADVVPEEKRIDYFYRLATSLISHDHVSNTLDLIANLASADLQSELAKKLIDEERPEWDFTSEQLKALKAFVFE